jgi:hypothetical protein
MIQKNKNYIKKYSIEVRCIDISNGLETDMFSLVWLDGLDNLNQNIVFKKLKSKEGFFNARQ